MVVTWGEPVFGHNNDPREGVLLRHYQSAAIWRCNKVTAQVSVSVRALPVHANEQALSLRAQWAGWLVRQCLCLVWPATYKEELSTLSSCGAVFFLPGSSPFMLMMILMAMLGELSCRRLLLVGDGAHVAVVTFGPVPLYSNDT